MSQWKLLFYFNLLLPTTLFGVKVGQLSSKSSNGIARKVALSMGSDHKENELDQ